MILSEAKLYIDGVVRGAAGGIRTGSVSINGGMCIAPDLPFGGVKSSGVGREWGREGIEEYTQTKAVGVGVAA